MTESFLSYPNPEGFAKDLISRAEKATKAQRHQAERLREKDAALGRRGAELQRAKDQIRAIKREIGGVEEAVDQLTDELPGREARRIRNAYNRLRVSLEEIKDEFTGYGDDRQAGEW